MPEATATDRTLVSIGIIAWNEEKLLPRMLESLFGQSLFEALAGRDLTCEILCLTNGCTDRTAAVAEEIFAKQSRQHPFRGAFVCRVLDMAERGKINAWNRFVHIFSAATARYLILMDADIQIDQPGTLRNMVAALETNPVACVSCDQPRKHIAVKPRKTLRDRFSLLASQMTQSADAQLCGQLYCIRAETARRIYLPRDLAACDDGFIKALVCTDFLSGPVIPGRIVQAPEASHTFEAYTSLRAVLKNQKRQMIGQAIVHILVDEYLKTLAPAERLNLAETLQDKERADPNWLKRLIDEHLRQTRYFWRLIPGLAGFRFRRLARLPGLKKVVGLPVAVAGFSVSMVSCFLAREFLKGGRTQYWPQRHV